MGSWPLNSCSGAKRGFRRGGSSSLVAHCSGSPTACTGGTSRLPSLWSSGGGGGGHKSTTGLGTGNGRGREDQRPGLQNGPRQLRGSLHLLPCFTFLSRMQRALQFFRLISIPFPFFRLKGIWSSGPLLCFWHSQLILSRLVLEMTQSLKIHFYLGFRKSTRG